MDLKKPAKGKVYLAEPEDDPTLIKGIDTDFVTGPKPAHASKAVKTSKRIDLKEDSFWEHGEESRCRG